MKIYPATIKGLVLLAVLSTFSGCRKTEPIPLTDRQRALCEKIRIDRSLEKFLRAVDTIDLNIPLEVSVDLVPRARFYSHGFVLFNPMARTIVVVSRDGKYLRTFGKIGSGPGEFRNLEVGAVDAEDNVYAFDDLLARVSVFTIDGVVLRTVPIRNPFLVRHMCVSKGGDLFLHHAPDSTAPGFVSVYTAGGLARCLVHPIQGYDSYYYRGHLEGELAPSAGGDVFETNTFSYKISRIRPDLTVSQFGEEGDDYAALPAMRSFQTIQQLQRAVAGATVIRQLLLCYHGTLLMQETLRLPTMARGLHRNMRVYDTAGVFLGALEFSDESFDASDGNRLLRVRRNPPDDREIGFDSTLPSLILYEVRHEPRTM